MDEETIDMKLTQFTFVSIVLMFLFACSAFADNTKCAGYLDKTSLETIRAIASALATDGLLLMAENLVFYQDGEVVGLELLNGRVIGCDPR